MGILVSTVRIAGFRGLENIEIDLKKTTVLTGANNTGKSSVLRTLQLALGSYQFITQDDFFIKGGTPSNKIVVDTLIVPVDMDHQQCNSFTDDWMVEFTENRIRSDGQGKYFFPFRTSITFDPLTSSFKKQQFTMKTWPSLDENNMPWFECEVGEELIFRFTKIPFFHVDVQRDVVEDIKLKHSYLGRMLSKIEYSNEDVRSIEKQLKGLNEQAVKSSEILSKIKSALEELNSAMDTKDEGIEITPFTKKIRDLNKGLSIYYSDQNDGFSMEYHGMGTRSWSSLLSLKAFISLRTANAKKEGTVFFPIIAIEEPEAHLHPNAQKKIYSQMDSMDGQKFISTHSPYVASHAKIDQLRNLYKRKKVTCGKVGEDQLSCQDIKKIETHILSTKGEMIFSKFIVFLEGATEREALPLLAQEFFREHPSDMGMNFIDVGGYKSYFPYLCFANALKIPWIILSDADQKDNTISKEVKKQILKSGIEKELLDKFVIFLDKGNNFEQQILNDGFEQQIRNAYKSILFSENNNLRYKQAKETEIKEYSKEDLLKIMYNDKIRMGRAIASAIVKDKKEIPGRIKDLFTKIKNRYDGEEVGDVS